MPLCLASFRTPVLDFWSRTEVAWLERERARERQEEVSRRNQGPPPRVGFVVGPEVDLIAFRFERAPGGLLALVRA